MKLMFIGVLMVLLNSCGGVNYSKRNGNGLHDTGFYDRPMKNGNHKVGFQGNGHNPREQVREFTLKRASELAARRSVKGYCILKDEFLGRGNLKMWPAYEAEVQFTNNLKGEKCYKIGDFQYE